MDYSRKIDFWWGANKNLVGEFFQVGGGGGRGSNQIFSWWKGTLPVPPSRKNQQKRGIKGILISRGIEEIASGFSGV